MRNIMNRFDRFVSMQSSSANSDWQVVGLTLSYTYSEK